MYHKRRFWCCLYFDVVTLIVHGHEINNCWHFKIISRMTTTSVLNKGKPLFFTILPFFEQLKFTSMPDFFSYITILCMYLGLSSFSAWYYVFWRVVWFSWISLNKHADILLSVNNKKVDTIRSVIDHFITSKQHSVSPLYTLCAADATIFRANTL